MGGKENSCLAVFSWIIGTLFFTIVLSLTFRVALPILFGGSQSSNMFHETSGFNDGDNIPTAEITLPPVLIESTTENSLNIGFVVTLAIEPQLEPSDTTIIDVKFTTIIYNLSILESYGSILPTQMTTLVIEPELSVSEVDFESISSKTGEDLLVNEMMFYDLDFSFTEDESAFNISMFKDADLPIMDTKTAVAISTEPQLDEQDKNNVVFSADESTLVIPIIEVFLLNDTPGATVPVKQTGPRTHATKSDVLFYLELEAEEITPEISLTLERYEDMANNLLPKKTIPVSTEMTSTAVLPLPMVTSVMKRPAPFPDFVFSKNKHLARPVVTAEKVAAQHSYDFFAERSTYVKSVEMCRHISKGSRLLSIEAVQEERIVDAYVKSHQNEIFGYAEEYSRYIWTGGYFDLESYQPYELRWIDHPASIEISSYRNFCPESRDVQSVIDQALFSLKAQTSGVSNLNPCDRRWAHVILDFTGHRIGRSCWQILDRDILSADGWKLPFICKR